MAGPGGHEVGRISVRVVPDTTGFRQKLKSELEAIERGLEVKVDVDADTKGVREKIKAATSNLDDAKIKLQVDDQFDYRLRQRLRKINEKVKVDVDVDRGALSRLSQKLSSFSGPKFGSGLNPAAYATIGVAALVAAAPVVGLITTALLAIPGVVAAVLTPIAALTLGMDGLKKAAEVLKEPFADLKETMSAKVQDQFTPVFEKLREVFPTLKSALPAVTQGMADFLGGITKAVTSPENLATIESTIRNIGTAIGNAAPGIESFTTGFLNLANSLSQKFPSIAEWFNGAGDSFDKWITKITTPTAGIGAGLGGGKSPLETAFEGLGTTIKTILDGLGKIGEKGFEFMKDPSKIEGFASALGSVATAMERIVVASDKLRDWDKKFRENFADPFEDNVLGQRQVPEFSDPTASWWDQVKASKLGESFKLENLFGPDTFDTSGLGDKLKQFFGSATGLGPLSDFFTNTIGVGMPKAAADTGQQAGVALGQGLGQGFQTSAAAGGIQTQVQQLGPQIQTALQGATAQLQTIPAQIQQAFSGVGAAVTGSMAVVVGAVTNAGSQIVAAFTGSLSQIPTVATQAFSQVQAAAAAGMANVVTAITTGAAQAVSAVQSMGQQIIAAMQQAAAGAQAAGAQVGAGMAAGIRSSTGQAVAAAQAMAAAVTSAAQVKLGIKSPSKVFHQIGEYTAEGMGLGLEAGFQPVIEKAKSLAQELTDAISSGTIAPDLQQQLKPTLDALELQRKQLQVNKDAIPKDDKEGRKGLQNQMDQITALKHQLQLQKDQLGFSDKYADNTDSVQQANSIITQQVASMIDGIKGFAMANANQFMSDLGMSGNGAVPTLANIGLDWASGMLSKTVSGALTGGGGTTINVGSVDDALAAKRNIDNRQALQYRTR